MLFRSSLRRRYSTHHCIFILAPRANRRPTRDLRAGCRRISFDRVGLVVSTATVLPLEARVRVLVTGGAGYIGSVVVAQLVDGGHEVTVIDNLSKGHVEAVARGAKLASIDLGDREAVARVIDDASPQATIHFAAQNLVGESMASPLRYYRGNVATTLNLLDALANSHCRALVISSTAAVYGAPTGDPLAPIDERHQLLPTNVYGDTKLEIGRAHV